MYAFMPLLAAWKAAIKISAEVKEKRFGKDARDGEKLLTGPYSWMYNTGAGDSDGAFAFVPGDSAAMSVTPKAPLIRMQVNKAAELVQLFGPVLYHKNPARFCEPRKPFSLDNKQLMSMYQWAPDLATAVAQVQVQGMMANEADMIQSQLIQQYINATPNPLDLKTHNRFCVDETLIKGGSCLWIESYIPAGTRNRVVGSFWDTVDNLFFDPSARTFDGCKWIVRRRCTTVEDCAAKFQIDPKELKGKMESAGSAAVVESGSELMWLQRARGSSQDMIVWYEIWSKIGLGGQMIKQMGSATQGLVNALQVGDYAYMAIAEGCDYPLNCPKQLFDQPATPALMDEIRKRFQWPIMFWMDGSWPMEFMRFHDIPNDPWPMSHLAPAMGELKFLNWFYSFIAGKVLITSRDFIAVKAAASEAVKAAMKSGSDLSVIELKASDGKVSDLVEFLSHPAINQDVFTAAQIIESNFEKRTGMSELLYGMSSRQYRSAAEAEIKQDAVNVRPEDMANRVEDSMSQIARLEALAARLTLNAQDVGFMCGPTMSMLWQQFVVPAPIEKFLYETVVRIEAGSVRKPNRSRDAENVTALIQQFGPMYQSFANMGIVEPFNALIKMWCQVRDMDASPYLLAPAAPPPMMQPQAPPPAK